MKNCCPNCYVKNNVYITSEDWCIDPECVCHVNIVDRILTEFESKLIQYNYSPQVRDETLSLLRPILITTILI